MTGPRDDEIIEIPIAGRTIVRASAWSDKSSMSIELDNGVILQIAARESLRGELYWELEEAP